MNDPDNVTQSNVPPLLTTELKNQVIKGLGNNGVVLTASNDDWSRLETILQRYETHAAFWEGFPKKSDAQKLLDAGKKAKILAGALKGLNEAGFGEIVRDQLQGHDFDAFFSTLQLLGEIDVRSPKFDDAEKPSWQSFLHLSAATMQVEIDRWWQDVAGYEPIVSEEGDAPYTYFLIQIFGCFSGLRLGGSRTAVEARRRLKREQKERLRAASRKLVD